MSGPDEARRLLGIVDATGSRTSAPCREECGEVVGAIAGNGDALHICMAFIISRLDDVSTLRDRRMGAMYSDFDHIKKAWHLHADPLLDLAEHSEIQRI